MDNNNNFISFNGVYVEGFLKEIKKCKTVLQPIYEAFTNSLESIKLNNINKGEIILEIYKNSLINAESFDKFKIIDNGIGFNEKEFERFNILKDTRKGIHNLGSGRIQFCHFFSETIFVSQYKENENYFERKFEFSKKPEFLKNNSFTKLVYKNAIEKFENSKTEITFSKLIDDSKKYNELTPKNLKDELIKRYLLYFVQNNNKLPKIIIKKYLDNYLINDETIEIKPVDLPELDNSKLIKVKYTIKDENYNIRKSDKNEEFNLSFFKISSDYIDEHKINLTSKCEIIESSQKIEFPLIALKESINNYFFLILISSDYIENLDSDNRGDEIKFIYRKEFEKDIYYNNNLIFEDLKEEIQNKIIETYPEIRNLQDKHNNNIIELKNKFLLDEEIFKNLKINLNDSENKILEKYYIKEAEIMAANDMYIKNLECNIKNLDPNSNNYIDVLNIEVKKITQKIPIQNKIALSHYVARRKIVLDLMQNILDNKLNIQNTTSRNLDEQLLHNLILRQGSNNNEENDLWIFNEEFIYFKGCSAKKLKNLTIDNKKLIKENNELNTEQIKILEECRTKLLDKIPDILLFPNEGKCIIIEFKNPNVEVEKHLNQIQNYATIILNFSRDDFRINNFYGYLIGESISIYDVQSSDPSYEQAINGNYFFKNSKVAGFNRPKGDIYCEVLNYSNLLERAKIRNKLFIEKLFNSRIQQ